MRAPAKRLSGETWIVGSNPTPSATIFFQYISYCPKQFMFCS